jgi:hypothetical protein
VSSIQPLMADAMLITAAITLSGSAMVQDDIEAGP